MDRQDTNKFVVLQGTMPTFVWPLVGTQSGMPKHPSRLSAATRVFSENLNTLVDYHGHNPTSAARQCKVSAVQMDRWLKCQISPTLDSVAKVAKGFGVEPYQLLIPDLHPRNLATLIASDVLARVSRARELLKDLEDGADEEGDGKGDDGGSDPPRPRPSPTHARRTSHDRRGPKEKKPRP